MVTLYSTGCPRCSVLKSKLDSANVEYETVSDVDAMKKLGIMQAPMLMADGWLMDFVTAVKWVNDFANEVK